MTELTPQQKKAMQEWMSRPSFWQFVPGAFFNDVCSEGIEDAQAIFIAIAERLELAARSYRMQRP
jgi:hypothetical protein